MACTLLAQDWARAHGGRIVALTVDHGLRPESRAEAEQVAAWMRARGIAHHILTPEHVSAGNNLMQAARQWRYDALADWCLVHGVRHCLLGHHKGDQRETVLLNAARGGDGLSGMPRMRNYRGVQFLRPLLDVEKAELENYLRAHAMGWVEDPSNHNTDFARVRVRQQLAADAAFRAAVDTQIVNEQTARRVREAALAEAVAACVTIDPAGYAVLQRAVWMALESALQQQLIADMLRCISGQTHRVRSAEIGRLVAALTQQTQGRRCLQHCLMTWNETTMHIEREPARVAAPLTLSGNGVVMWDQRFRVDYAMPHGYAVQLAALGFRGRKMLWTPSFPEFAFANSRGIQKKDILDSPRIFLKKNSGNDGVRNLPLATPALWHLDELVALPHIPWAMPALPPNLRCTITFAPAKPLAAAPFW